MQTSGGRRKGSAATESEARDNSLPTPRHPTPVRSQSANRRAAALSSSASIGGAASSSSTSARSGSQPKQRGGNTSSNSTNRSASTGRGNSNNATAASSGDTKTAAATQIPFEATLTRMKKAAAGKSEEQLSLLLQQLLQQRQFEDAAYLIAASPALEAKYKTSDVIRLLLDVKQFDKAAQLIRDMKLHSNQLLVTLFIKELVRASLFQAAVRYAQEMVQNFGKNDFGPRDQARPSWTPQALILAMIRAQQFRSALKYAKQFGLLELFPPTQLIASMFEARSWDEAVSSVLEFRLFQEFPLEVLVPKLLEHRQWSNAVKCINKLPTQEMIEKAYEALVREAARVGDFVTSLRYLREFKLDQKDANASLIKYFVDCMIAHGEFYKAIKYSLKFGMNVPPPDTEETGETSVYDTEVLIRKAIECGQYHVALLYIKKLKLKEKFAKELVMIQQLQERMLQEFHQFMAARSMQYQHPHVQSEMAAILGQLGYDEQVDQVVVTEVVISQEEEIFPRKTRKPSDDVLSGEPRPEETLQVAAATTEGATTVSVASDASMDAPRRSSRFSFARADSVIASAGQSALPPVGIAPQQQPQPVAQKPISRAPPPGLAPPTPTPTPTGPSTDAASAASFNFAQFAATLQSGQGSSMPSGPPPSAPPPQPQQQSQPPQPPHGLSHLFPHQAPSHPNTQRPGGFYPPPPPPPQFGGMPNQRGYSGPPPPPQQQPPPMPMYYQSSQPGFSQPPPPPNGSMPPPPMPPHFLGSNGGGTSSGSFDISSLAMQFHARPQGSGYGNGGFDQFGQGGPPPPPMPPGMPGGLFPSMGPPMQGFPPQPQPQFSFKPSVSYTSVTTTRQKK